MNCHLNVKKVSEGLGSTQKSSGTSAVQPQKQDIVQLTFDGELQDIE